MGGTEADAISRSPAGTGAPVPKRATADDLALYALYRDYIKHEDGLMISRLTAFLTLNSFLVATSVLILGALLTALNKMGFRSNTLIVVWLVGTVVHTIVARLGNYSAVATTESLSAAMRSLAILRDSGNGLLHDALCENGGPLPALTNAKLLTQAEKDVEDVKKKGGTSLMRHIPGEMGFLWVCLGSVPVILLPLILIAHYEHAWVIALTGG